MSKKLLTATIILALMGTVSKSFALSGLTAAQAAAKYKSILSAYKTAGLMRLDIKSVLWLYDSVETRLDSAMGNYYVNGQKLYADIGDGSAYLRNDHWIVQLVRDQNEIYVDTVAYNGDSAINLSNQNLKADPFLYIDSLVSDTTLLYTYNETNDSATIVTRYPLGNEILESTVLYSKTNYRLIYCEYKIAMKRDTTIASTPPATLTGIRHFILRMSFSQTTVDQPGDYYFDQSRFFRKSNGVLVPSENYPGFKIIPLYLMETPPAE